MIKRIPIILPAIVVIITAAFLWQHWAVSNGRTSVSPQRKAAPPVAETAPTSIGHPSSTLTDEEGWLHYSNPDYKFAFSYPGTWEIADLTPSSTTPMAVESPAQAPRLELSLSDTGGAGLPSSFGVDVFAKEDSMSIDDWWTAYLSSQDQAKAKCLQANAGSPCLSLRDRIENDDIATFQGGPARRVRSFAFDHVTECVIFGRNGFVYQLCYDVTNPNDPAFTGHQQASDAVLQSFQLLPAGTDQ